MKNQMQIIALFITIQEYFIGKKEKLGEGK